MKETTATKRTTTKTTPFDPANYIHTREDCALYLQAAMDEAPGDATFFVRSLGHVARSKGMAKAAKAAGVTREALYRSLSEQGNPGLQTVFRILDFLGVAFVVKSKAA